MKITIASFNDVAQAHIAKGLLESNGIHADLKNELVAQTMPFGSMADVELQVEDADVDHAKQVLQDTDF